MQNDFEAKELIEIWESIGLANPWIKDATDPAFSKFMLIRVANLKDLKSIFQHGNWCLGQGFHFQNLCFINQIDGGDEWLTIKDDYAFESVTFQKIIETGQFETYIQRLLKASKNDCINLDY